MNNGPFGPVIDLDGKFGLHAGLRPFKDLWDKKLLAIVEATGSPDPSRSHFDAQDYMESGTPGKTGDGWLNRALGAAGPDATALRAVALSNRVPRCCAASMRPLRWAMCRISTFPTKSASSFCATCIHSLPTPPCAGPVRMHSRP